MARPVIALIGAGQMGSSHARVISESDEADLGIVIDANAVAAEVLGGASWVRSSTNLRDAAKADGVVIASSTASHVACALPFLDAGKPVFIEKPLAPTLAEVDELLDLARRRDAPLMCGFVERFNAAFRTGAAMLTSTPTHVLTVRHSPPAPRIGSSVVSDMLLHDLDLVLGLFGGESGSLVGSACHTPAGSDYLEIADCSVKFRNGIANMSANRMGQRKVRTITLHSPGQLIEVDLLRQDVTVYRNVSQEMVPTHSGVGYRSSTVIELPFVRHSGEPLSLQFAHFLTLVAGQVDHVAERESIRAPHALAEAIECAATQQLVDCVNAR